MKFTLLWIFEYVLVVVSCRIFNICRHNADIAVITVSEITTTTTTKSMLTVIKAIIEFSVTCSSGDWYWLYFILYILFVPYQKKNSWLTDSLCAWLPHDIPWHISARLLIYSFLYMLSLLFIRINVERLIGSTKPIYKLAKMSFSMLHVVEKNNPPFYPSKLNDIAIQV